MRIVSYNILDGGGRRAELLGDVIDAQQPDVVGLVEAEHVGVVEELAGRLAMDFVHAPGNSHASALLSRWTIRDSINHVLLQPTLSKSLLEATVIDPAGREWVFGVLHLHAHATEADERRREEELEVILRVFAPHREAGPPHILCGDFNANSPVQQIDPARCKPRTRKEWEQNGGYLPRRVVQRLLDAGYVDSLQAVYPRQAQTTASFTTEYPGQRVDYVFTFGIDPARIKSACVYQIKPAADASDHFPVGAEIPLGRGTPMQGRACPAVAGIAGHRAGAGPTAFSTCFWLCMPGLLPTALTVARGNRHRSNGGPRARSE